MIKSRVKVSAPTPPAGNGNGHTNGNGNGAHGPKHTLRLFLPRSRDFDADIRVMQSVDELLRASTGEDDVVIALDSQGARVLLKPHYTVRCGDDLVGPLRGVLGAEAVVIE